jgi:hypothetical protein
LVGNDISRDLVLSSKGRIAMAPIAERAAGDAPRDRLLMAVALAQQVDDCVSPGQR